MITEYTDTALKSYYNQLYNIQDRNPRSTAILLPDTEKIYEVNLDSRTIEQPQTLRIVESDHVSETIYFRVPRYFDNMDMANTTCIITYTNAKKEQYIYAVPYYDIVSYRRYTPYRSKDNEEGSTTDENSGLILYDEKNDVNIPTIFFPWRISNLATVKTGDITFAMQFYILADDKEHYLYNLHTLPQTMKIYQGLNLNSNQIQQDTLVNKQALDFEAFLEQAEAYQRDVTWTVLE